MFDPLTADDSTDRFGASRRRFLGAVGAVGAGLAASGTAIAQQSSASASATFDDQTTDGTSVTVQSATLPEGGFVAIHDAKLLEQGELFESVIGVSDALDAGTHEDLKVMLYQGVPGNEFDQSMLKKDQALIAMPHLDTNGNGTYDFITSNGEADGPYTMDGGPVVDTAMVSVKSQTGGGAGAGGEMTTDVCFPDQTTDGTSVTVQSATLPKGGFVAIHDAELLKQGKLFESVIGVSDALDAGTHEDLKVALYQGVPGNEFDQSMLKDGQTLIAMPHFDTNGNGTYDFVTSNGEADGPYTMNGKPVVNPATISVDKRC